MQTYYNEAVSEIEINKDGSVNSISHNHRRFIPDNGLDKIEVNKLRKETQQNLNTCITFFAKQSLNKLSPEATKQVMIAIKQDKILAQDLASKLKTTSCCVIL